MKKLILLFCFTVFLTPKIYPQLWIENFEYPDGDTLANYWYSIAPLGVEYMRITSPGLTFPSYAGSGIGNAVKLDTTTPDGVAKIFNFPGISIGSIYTSLMINVFSAGATGSYFASLSPHPQLANSHCFIFIRDSLGKVAFGISKKSEAPIYTPAQYLKNSTHLLILKYTFNPGALNDSLSLFVFSSAPPSAEPAPTLGPKGGPDPDMNNIGVFDLFKSGNPLGAIVDGIYVDDTWNDAILPVELSSFNAIVIRRDVILNWSTLSEINNYGFEVERSNVQEQSSNEWMNVGFISGQEISNNPHNYLFKDKNLNTGKYNYRLKQIDLNGSFKYFDLDNEVIIGVPIIFSLSQNYPNPFNPVTKIDFEIRDNGKVKLLVYDNTGRVVSTILDEYRAAGYYSVEFNGSNLTSGVYFYKMETDGTAEQKFTAVKKMIFLK